MQAIKQMICTQYFQKWVFQTCLVMTKIFQSSGINKIGKQHSLDVIGEKAGKRYMCDL